MTPRTACTAIGKLLREELSGEWLPSEDILNPDGSVKVRKKHCSLKDLIGGGVITLEESEKLTKVAAVRNPFDSLVSLYIKKRTKYTPLLADPTSWVYNRPGYADDIKFCQEHSFEEWIIKHHPHYQIKKILKPKSKQSMFDIVSGVDEIIHFENIQYEFSQVLKKYRITLKSEIPLHNVTQERTNKQYRQYYTKKTRKIVEYFYQKDLEKYEYQY